MAFGVKRKEWTTREVERLRKLWAMECTSGQIAEAMGRSRNSICSAARRFGLPERGCPIPAKPDLVRQYQAELARVAAIEELMRL